MGLTTEALNAASEAYFGVISEDRFWKKVLPVSPSLMSGRAISIADGRELQETAKEQIYGNKDKNIAPPDNLIELKERLESVFNISDKYYRWESRHVSRNISRKASESASRAACEAMNMNGRGV